MKYIRFFLLISCFFVCFPGFVFSEVSPKIDITKMDNLEKKISVDFFNAELKDVVKVFTQQTGVNFVINNDVTGTKVSMFLDNVSIQEALNSIATAYNLEFYQIPGTSVYRVKQRVAAEEDLRITRVYKLKYIRIGSMKLMKSEEDDTSAMQSQSGVALSSMEGAEGIKTQGGLVNALTNVLSKDGILTFDDRANMIVITDYVDRFDRIEKIIEALDRKLDQVLIKAEIIELSDTLSNILGVQYGGADGAVLTSTAATSVHAYPWSKNKYTGKYIKQFNFTDYDFADLDQLELGTITADFFSVVINALENSTKAKYLSRPRILTMDCEPAIVDITANTAVQQTLSIDQETDRETFEYEREKTGIMLRVTPHINGSKEFITMFIEPSVTRAFNSEFFPTDALDVQTRKVRTKIRVKNGDTVAIGGLFAKKVSDTRRKLPLLGDIPVFGAVFTNKEKQNNESDLMVFITPSIIDENNVDQLHKRDEAKWAEKEKEKEKSSWFSKKK
ncbi:hypothetical protein KKC59_04665, partial [bacterium]|nr:hypothetical protein [bacterium]